MGNKLMVRGRKDGVLREVIHIPIHGGTHQTRIANNEKQFFGFLMLLEGVAQVINEDRIVKIKR